MTSIILRTGPVKVGRKRPVDSDHAVSILDLTRRGYTVNAADGETQFSVSFLRYPDQAFVNQPAGTDNTMRMHVNYGTENAALYDAPIPDWVKKLDKLIRRVAPATLHISSNMILNGDTNG